MQVSVNAYVYTPTPFGDGTTEKQEAYKAWVLPKRPPRVVPPMRPTLPFEGDLSARCKIVGMHLSAQLLTHTHSDSGELRGSSVDAQQECVSTAPYVQKKVDICHGNHRCLQCDSLLCSSFLGQRKPLLLASRLTVMKSPRPMN